MEMILRIRTILLECLLNEIKRESGSIEINGKIYYVTQTPWIYTDTIKNNILFFKNFVKEDNDKKIKKCGLEKDIRHRRDGDNSKVNENDLSGGQKARIFLARAIYANSDIYLFDEPLCAIDNEDSESIRKKNGLLKDRTRIVATHRIENWNFCDRVIFLENGSIAFNHTFENFINSPFYQKIKVEEENY